MRFVVKQRRSSTVALAVGALLSLASSSTTLASSAPTVVVDPSLAMIVPGLIIVAFIGEMFVLLLRKADDWS